MRLQMASDGGASPFTLYLTGNAESGTAAETSYTYGWRLTADKAFTIGKIGVLCRTSAIGTSQDVRFGIWNDAATTLLASTPQTTILNSRVSPQMVSFTVPLTVAPSIGYRFGLYIPSGSNGANYLGPSSLAPSPSGFLTPGGSALAGSGFIAPIDLPIPYGPPLVLSD